MNQFTFNNTRTDYRSYSKFIELYHQYSNCNNTPLLIDIDNWFDANLCSPLGAVLDLLQNQMVDTYFDEIDPGARVIMQKNDFLSYYSHPREYDEFGTTIRYRKFKSSDGRFFVSYVRENLLEHSAMPDISLQLRDKIMEVLFELFTNAQIHSETKTVYACGQFFPKKHEIKFTLTDTGVGFRNKINSTFNWNLSATEAIEWAMEDRNSTKQDIPGGIGLALLKEFICLNKGVIQIVSDNGYYAIRSDGVTKRVYVKPFPGTMINLTFRTDDNNSYALSDEINDIF